MKNAHLRLGRLEFTKRTKDTTTQIRLYMDRFIGEATADKREPTQAHLVSVLGGDQEIGAVWAAVIENSLFTVAGPALDSVMVWFGEGAQCFRGTLSVPGRKRPVRHLVALSAELASTQARAEAESNRTVLCDDDSTFVLHRVAQRFGLPVAPEWSGWFMEELGRRKAARPLIGLGCSPLLVMATKKALLKWIGSAIKRQEIWFPERNGPITWNVPTHFLKTPEEQEGEALAEPAEFRDDGAGERQMPVRKIRLEEDSP